MAWLWGICRGYGRMAGLWGSAKTYGGTAIWENGRPMGICQNVWGYRMGRWPGYGGSAVAMGEWPAYGDLPKRMGEPRYRMGKWPAWKAAESHGGAAKTYGKYHRTWETAPAYGEAARPYGEPKITSKPEILERWAACGLADFNEFLVGGGGPAFATVKASHRACCECRGA